MVVVAPTRCGSPSGRRRRRGSVSRRFQRCQHLRRHLARRPLASPRDVRRPCRPTSRGPGTASARRTRGPWPVRPDGGGNQPARRGRDSDRRDLRMLQCRRRRGARRSSTNRRRVTHSGGETPEGAAGSASSRASEASRGSSEHASTANPGHASVAGHLRPPAVPPRRARLRSGLAVRAGRARSDGHRWSCGAGAFRVTALARDTDPPAAEAGSLLQKS